MGRNGLANSGNGEAFEADLQSLVEAWPTLAKSTKSAIAKLIEAESAKPDL